MESADLNAEIVEALKAYFDAIAAQKLSDLTQRPSLRLHFERLDFLCASLSSDADPQLRHFMERKSYEKALALLKS